jgi:hypothetical protein
VQRGWSRTSDYGGDHLQSEALLGSSQASTY